MKTYGWNFDVLNQFTRLFTFAEIILLWRSNRIRRYSGIFLALTKSSKVNLFFKTKALEIPEEITMQTVRWRLGCYS